MKVDWMGVVVAVIAATTFAALLVFRHSDQLMGKVVLGSAITLCIPAAVLLWQRRTKRSPWFAPAIGTIVFGASFLSEMLSKGHNTLKTGFGFVFAINFLLLMSNLWVREKPS